MAVDFRVVEHSVIPGAKLVEVILGGKVVGAIYPRDDGIFIASAHFVEKDISKDFDGEVIVDDGKNSFPPIQGIQISFKPRKYCIIGGRIVYME